MTGVAVNYFNNSNSPSRESGSVLTVYHHVQNWFYNALNHFRSNLQTMCSAFIFEYIAQLLGDT